MDLPEGAEMTYRICTLPVEVQVLTAVRSTNDQHG